MRKISLRNWNMYKESREGSSVIADFEQILKQDASPEQVIDIARKYNAQYFKNFGEKAYYSLNGVLRFFDDLLCEEDANWTIEETTEDYKAYFEDAIWWALSDGEHEDERLEDIPQSAFKMLLNDIMVFSIALYQHQKEFFLPNLFVMQFSYLKKMAEKYEINLPPVPKRSDYKGRCMYYVDLNTQLVEFFKENQIESPAERCAFIYGYEFPLIKEEMENSFAREIPETPEQAWLLVGNYGDEERNMESGFWQANQLTCKGDLMLFYEKSPVKKLNSVWIALEDGVIDPFFNYYSNSYIGHKIEIPNEMAISYADFKANEYFQQRDKAGNFVSKNFQDCSGWQVTSDDYKEIRRMLEAKGFDTSKLPSLYEPLLQTAVEIQHESDVSQKLLIPMLEEMGWIKDVDFKSEVEFNAGRGTTGHKMKKRPDFCLHLSESAHDLSAKVVIEVKLHMKNIQEVEQNYDQGLSYAKWGNAQVLVLCDKAQIRVYERENDGYFKIDKYSRFRWEDLKVLEKFNRLKHLLSR